MTTVVIVMSYGTPTAPGEVASFYTDVRRGRAPTPQQLEELVARYAAIGGLSPLTARSQSQVAALQAALEAAAPGHFAVYYGTKHGSPKLEEAIAEAAACGDSALVGVVLAPHYSALSVGEYLERAALAAKTYDLPATFVRHYGSEPELVELLASRAEDALSLLRPELAAEAEVLFSAHSLPARILESDDPYPTELAETAALVANAAGLRRFRTAWQSAGRTGEPWLGPDIVEVLGELASSGTRAVVVCPAGFTSDHLEILYDLDVAAAERARRLGLSFVRTASLNDDPLLARLLARLVVDLDLSLQGLATAGQGTSVNRPRLAVIGGGIAGLAAARAASLGHDVTVFEAADSPGGKLRSGRFRGRVLDLGPDAFITRNGAGERLCRELGLGGELITPASSSAAVYARGALRPLPKGLALGIPTDLRALAISGIVSPGRHRAPRFDLVLPGRARPDLVEDARRGRRDPSVAEIVAPRLGREIHDALVDPLIGGINASDVSQLSFVACAPQLAALLVGERSLMKALRPLSSARRRHTGRRHTGRRHTSRWHTGPAAVLRPARRVGGARAGPPRRPERKRRGPQHEFHRAGPHACSRFGHPVADRGGRRRRGVRPRRPRAPRRGRRRAPETRCARACGRMRLRFPYAGVVTLTLAWPASAVGTRQQRALGDRRDTRLERGLRLGPSRKRRAHPPHGRTSPDRGQLYVDEMAPLREPGRDRHPCLGGSPRRRARPRPRRRRPRGRDRCGAGGDARDHRATARDRGAALAGVIPPVRVRSSGESGPHP